MRAGQLSILKLRACLCTDIPAVASRGRRRPLSIEQSSLTCRSISLNGAQSCADSSCPGIAKGQNMREGQRQPPDFRSIPTAEHKSITCRLRVAQNCSTPCRLHHAARREDLQLAVQQRVSVHRAAAQATGTLRSQVSSRRRLLCLLLTAGMK